MRHFLEYIPVWLFYHGMRLAPRPVVKLFSWGVGRAVLRLHRKLRRVGLRNLELAFPGMPAAERIKILRGTFDSLGRLLAVIVTFSRWTPENVHRYACYDGLEHYEAARARGKGVLLLTAHVGGWEVGSYFHSLMGRPMHIVVRELDNPYLDRFVRRLRERHGNQTHDKNKFARGLLAAMRAGETVGVLMDTNMSPPQGVFVNFFGMPACTGSGVARVALHTDAAVVPAYTLWDPAERRYHVCFEPAIPAIRTGDTEADAVANTQAYTAALERVIRAHPDQWLWVHRRWKTRPEGEASLY